MKDRTSAKSNDAANETILSAYINASDASFTP